MLKYYINLFVYRLEFTAISENIFGQSVDSEDQNPEDKEEEEQPKNIFQEIIFPNPISGVEGVKLAKLLGIGPNLIICELIERTVVKTELLLEYASEQESPNNFPVGVGNRGAKNSYLGYPLASKIMKKKGKKLAIKYWL